VFSATEHLKKKLKTQSLIRMSLAIITVSIVIPIVCILSILVIKGGPAISWEFLTAEPLKGMTAGGIFPAIVGTLWLVGLSLFFSCPVGVISAVYLSEYAPDNWLTRAINLAIINLAGVPSIVHALFGLGAFVQFLEFGTSILAASLRVWSRQLISTGIECLLLSFLMKEKTLVKLFTKQTKSSLKN